MALTTELSTDQLAALVQQKLDILTMLVRLAEQQLALVAGGQTTLLLKLLATKQLLILQLQRIERQLNPFRGEDPEQRVWRTPADRTRCQEQADRCRALLTQIVRLERQAEGEMVQRRDAAAACLQGVHSAAEAGRAYAAAAYAPALFDSREKG